MHIFQQGMKMGVFYRGCWKMMSCKSCNLGRSLCTLFLIQQICLFPSWVVVCLLFLLKILSPFWLLNLGF
ncbi:hypothetical protein HanXRQr2_Chr15g0687371 [Helianthus annuus]|uniref:Uncharacterized protein n=1 Tax=Helianthus annuus TaxID=4232 RepID=A0A9K3H2U6_HELAN|nr:hypothetical protein HanXRQr2_Chr15g0687371 [Helianthus annuus]KAJ0830781.1 hypothetical protein HanPSC8_Chr15g0659371 [Helianthus annuus]